ncbi:uncharacterized protein BO97DRAFT_437582 [Aspergillus homomorphus CBS 101889]|uniref:Rhodopsin domain-containing protein n=1 Tax=Aspergillus homomorphus (strain CBS 101889) TaxID=1450537 RepID=A0A395HKV9_ASPHC|nr:hypothetical protein BO97DRAFT_437582 [Aspergillus homomorphus CBS 101889]RAL08487.1 hypothetical protein BO97DRAFT_437582 [Aspergillus homomorphus CBS 101889]
MKLTLTGIYNTRQLQIVVINSVLVVLSVTAVLLRFWARHLQRLRPFPEDYLIAVTWALALGVNILLFQSLHAGVGEHVDTLTNATVEEYSLNLYVMQLFWNTCLPTIKLSISLFYQRIFPVRSMMIACRSVIVFLFAWYLAFQTTAIFQCIPIHHGWQKKITEGRCIDFVPFVISLAATNLCTDVLLLALPTREIWKLQVPRGKKIGLSVIFTLGVMCVLPCPFSSLSRALLSSVCVVSVFRLENLIAIRNADITWSDTYSHLWTAIESSLGVVVACLPSLMPIVRLIRNGKTGRGQPGRAHSSSRRESSFYPVHMQGSYELSQMSNRNDSGPGRTRLRAGSSDSALIAKDVGEIDISTEITQQVDRSLS